MPRTSWTVGLLAAAAMLAGCDNWREVTEVPTKEVERTGRAEFPAAPARDPSVPPASVALGSTNEKPPAVPPAELHTGTLNRSTESAAMPLGGQNNDHSAPKATEPGGAASAPAAVAVPVPVPVPVPAPAR